MSCPTPAAVQAHFDRALAALDTANEQRREIVGAVGAAVGRGIAEEARAGRPFPRTPRDVHMPTAGELDEQLWHRLIDEIIPIVPTEAPAA